MTDVLSREISDLEEMFANEVPCGGNEWPTPRPCPHDAPAVMVSVDSCDNHPARFKCLWCFEIWYRSATRSGWDTALCSNCGRNTPLDRCFRPL